MNWQHIAVRTGLTTLALALAVAAPASAAVVINEVESQDAGGGSDWVELMNTGAAPQDITGWVLRDSGNGNNVTIGAKILQPGEIFAQNASGLGNDDQARLFDGATEVARFAWGPHALDTYGRCPDGTGVFRQTAAPTKGAANHCAPFGDAWPGGAAITEQPSAMFVGGENVSGLAYQASGTSARGTLWAVQNSPSMLYKLVWDGTQWTNATGWATGKQMDYPAPLNGVPDAEGVTFADGDANGLYVATERDGGGGSMPAVLRIDATRAAPLQATTMWDLSGHLPGLPANEGPEAITFVPDSLLVAKGFKESNGTVYNPANYAGHGSGLFLVGVEATGEVVAFALQSGGLATRIATFPSGFRKVMDLTYEPETKRVWAVCDDSCDGQTAILEIGGDGKFAVAKQYERPAGMQNFNNEGFAIAPQAECAGNRKPTFYVDDSALTGVILREGTINCAPPAPDSGGNGGNGGDNGDTGGTPEPGVTPTPTPTPAPMPQPLLDRTAPSLKVTLKLTRKTGRLGVTTTLGEQSNLTIKVTARKNAKAKARTLLTSTRKNAAAGKTTFTLTLKRSIRAKLRTGETVTISIVARDAAGNATTKTAGVKVR